MAILPIKNNRIFPVLFLILFICIALPLYPQNNKSVVDIDQWFSLNKEAVRYLPIKSKIESIFYQAGKEKLPEWILFEKLEEGSSKKIKAEVLVLTLEDELRYLRFTRQILEEIGVSDEDRAAYEETQKTLTVYLLGGFSEELLKDVLILSLKREMTMKERLLLCGALVKIKITGNLDNKDLLKLAGSLITGRISPDEYSSIASLFRKGKIGHIQDETLLIFITGILDKGGGLIQLNDEINRRIKKR